jgi:uncharacterized protein
MRSTLFLAAALLACACDAQANRAGESPAPRAVAAGIALTGRVVDQADLLDAAEEARIDRVSEALERRTTDQLVVVTLPSLGQRPIEDVALDLGRGWGIGQAGKDNGVVILVAPNERKVRIEVGYGLMDGILPDERAHEIIQRDMLPHFRDGRFAEGIARGADAVAATLVARADQPRVGHR